MIVLEDPVTARLVGWEDREQELTKLLSYIDKRVDFELKKSQQSLRKFTGSSSRYLQESLGEVAYRERVESLSAKVLELKSQRKKTLLFRDDRGLWTYSGVARTLMRGKDSLRVDYHLPDPRPIPWDKPPEHEDRDYQVESHDLLLAAAVGGPCGVELATGAGKSTVVRNLLKTLGLRALVMAPSTSIARQLHDDLVRSFGARRVGLYGDGKKDFRKLIVVGIDDSLTRVEPGSETWRHLSDRDVFVADESHLCPADTLTKVCFGLARRAPYRFFFSATQLRNDGLDAVLAGIVGEIVLRKTVRELVDEGYLARPVFKMVRVRASSSYSSGDVNRMTRQHLYYNPNVYRAAADLANKFVEHMRRPVVILVEELEQFGKLLPHLRHPARFAHGPLSAVSKGIVPEEYRADKPKDLVEAFNRGEFPVLVGTSCIATGTDVRVAGAGIYLMGGISPIKIPQAVGRETRGGRNSKVFNPMTGDQKVDCVHVDFDVVDPDLRPGDQETFPPHRHALARAEMYEQIYGPVEFVDL